MGARNTICALLPVALSLACLVALLMVLLAGITNHSLDIFTIRTKDLSISTSEVANIAKLIGRDVQPTPTIARRIDLGSLGDDASSIVGSLSTLATSPAVESAVSSVVAANPSISGLAESAKSIAAGNNITAKDLMLADEYRVFLWNYCSFTGSSKNCTDRGFNWAAKTTNISVLEDTARSVGVDLELPSELKTALKTFSTVLVITQGVYIFAAVAAGTVLLLGLIILAAKFCQTCDSGVWACMTHLLSWISTIAILIASILATVLAAVTTKAVSVTTQAYGVTGKTNTSFLTTTWLAFAFGVAATLFWAIAGCCCKSSSNSSNRKSYAGLGRRSKHRDADGEEIEKLQPVDYNNTPNPGYSPRQTPSPYIDQTPQMNQAASPNAYQPVFGHGAGEYQMQTQSQPGLLSGQQRINTGEGYEGYRHHY